MDPREVREQIERLTPGQRVVLERRLLARYAAAHAAYPGLPSRDPSGRVALSFSQERLWFLEQLAPGRPIYNIGTAERLTGPLDVAALRWAVDHVVERHETQRTTFDCLDGQPVGCVGPPRPVPFEEI